MNEKEKDFNEDLEPGIAGKLSEDLKAIFKPDESVPAEVDKAIIDRAHRYLKHRRQKVHVLRWLSTAAAVAAVIVFVILLGTPEQNGVVPSSSDFITVRNDIDRNGSVDILDAFKLAKHIESAETPDIKWDINEDGLVNRKDVDTVALAAVRLVRAGVL